MFATYSLVRFNLNKGLEISDEINGIQLALYLFYHGRARKLYNILLLFEILSLFA